MAAKFNSRMRWPDDPPPSPGEPGCCEIIAGDDDAYWDFDAVSEAANMVHDNLPAVIKFWANVSTPDKKPPAGALLRLQSALAESLEQIDYPFGKVDAVSPSLRPSKSWQSYAQTLAHFIIGEMMKAGHPQPSISRNSVVVRIVDQVMKRKRVPQTNTLSTSTIAAFLGRWEAAYGLTPRGIALLTTNASRAICAQYRAAGLCHLPESEFELRVGQCHEREDCENCQTCRGRD
jgi:hypothetical protein